MRDFFFTKLNIIIKGTSLESAEAIKSAITTEQWGIPEESLQQFTEYW